MSEWYWFLPSVIFGVLGTLVFFTWMLGTDWYDTFRHGITNKSTDTDSLDYLQILYVMNFGVGTGAFLVDYHNQFPLFTYLWNGWLAIHLVAGLGVTVYTACESINKYCLKKRGKLE